METRICGLCGTEKPLEEYQRNKSNPLGRAYWCKECSRDFDRERNKRPDRRLQINQWEQSERGKQLRSKNRREDYALNKEQYRARRMIEKLVKQGIIRRLPCQTCGNEKSVGHHPDYSKPLKVVWLCQKHHSELNRKVNN